ncbi:hypothetical protein JTB14_021719 [Gonioctena quinquepunctata]|nr:hypothetical protein JTB14_021719 [Gonioctena quinquepunctata]
MQNVDEKKDAKNETIFMDSIIMYESDLPEPVCLLKSLVNVRVADSCLINDGLLYESACQVCEMYSTDGQIQIVGFEISEDRIVSEVAIVPMESTDLICFLLQCELFSQVL